MGRYWDDLRAEVAQVVGLGSVIYVFVLATLVWVVGLPLNPKRWEWRIILTDITLTSLPALLYAIPVERFMSVRDAIDVNVAFLGTVALWRCLWFS